MDASLLPSVKVNASRAGTAKSLECSMFPHAYDKCSNAVGIAVITPFLMRLLLGSHLLSSVSCGLCKAWPGVTE